MMTPLDRLAGEMNLECEITEVPALPLEPAPDAGDTPRLYLVEFRRPRTDVAPLRVIYGLRTFGMPEAAPCITDVLFYLAVQASQMDRCGEDRARWLAIVGLEGDDAAAASLFAQQVALTRHLRALLDQAVYESLLEGYQAELDDDP